jgi:predicted nucleic acid-binding protein
MIGLDCNILVQLALGDHPANAKTLAAVQAETQRGEKLVFPPLVATEFLHVVTDERRFSPPPAMTEAMQWLEDLLTSPSVGLIQPDATSLDQTLK